MRSSVLRGVAMLFTVMVLATGAVYGAMIFRQGADAAGIVAFYVITDLVLWAAYIISRRKERR